MFRPKIASSPAYRWGATCLFVAAAVILAALAFEHIGGMRACPLCLQQRWAYYAGIPAAFVALVLLSASRPRGAAALFGLVAIAFLANAGLGGYHAGIEWGWWPGPDTCTGIVEPLSRGGNLLETLKTSPPIVRCDAPTWSFAGLSFAGWNVVASLILFTASVKAALAAREHEEYL
jgi:disulfide bond formation protein DsbB